jgi:hypothetical protein
VLRTWQGIRRQHTWSQEQAAPGQHRRDPPDGPGPPTTPLYRRGGPGHAAAGYAILTRRSELVHLDVADLIAVDQGLVATVWRRKTDPEGKDVQFVAVPYGKHLETCPVRA